MPVDVQKAEIDCDWQPVSESLRTARFVDENALDRAVDLLNADGNQNIVVLAGPGVLHAHGIDALRAFAERFDIPVATTLSGKGVIPESHPLALGVFGYGGSHWAIDAIRSDETDILLVVGSGLSQRDTMQWDPKMLPSKALIHIDADPLLIGRTWANEVAVVGNAGEALQRLAAINNAAGLEAGRAQRRAFLARDPRQRAAPIQPGRHQERRRPHAPGAGRGGAARRLPRRWRVVRGLGRAPGMVCRILGYPEAGHPLLADQPRADGRGDPARHRRKACPARSAADGRHRRRLHADARHGGAYGGARESAARHRADEQPLLRQHLLPRC